MILTVTPNPAVDMTWRTTELRPGETHRVPAGASRAGGKGLNVARVLHEAGIETHVLAAVAGATGDEFRRELEASGVAHTLLASAVPTRRCLAIVDETHGEATVFNEIGAGTVPAEVWASALAAEADVVAISGSLPADETPEALVATVRALRARGSAVVVDTGGSALLAAADAGATVLKPNREELVGATGLDDVRAGIAELLRRGATAVLASLGTDGLLLTHRDGRSVRAWFPQVVHGNATGAGDAVTAAITVSLRHDPELAAADAIEQLARRAVAWGAAAVAMPLAGSTDPQLRARTDDVSVVADPTADPAPEETSA